MIDLLGFALKLSLPFIGILNKCFIPPSPITDHVPTTVLFSRSFIHKQLVLQVTYPLTITTHIHDLSWKKSLIPLDFETKSQHSKLTTLTN